MTRQIKTPTRGERDNSRGPWCVPGAARRLGLEQREQGRGAEEAREKVGRPGSQRA